MLGGRYVEVLGVGIYSRDLARTKTAGYGFP